MTSPFLTYELLTPETADPVVLRITGQKARGFPDFTASNGIPIQSVGCPQYYRSDSSLYLRGTAHSQDDQKISIPLSDWPAVKQAIRELNEYYGETNMKEEIDKTMNTLLSGRKEVGSEHGEEIEPGNEPDTYEFDLNAFDYNLIITERILRVTHKKPKVCVEWRLAKTVYHNELAGPPGQGELYRVVQFRVTGDGEPYKLTHRTKEFSVTACDSYSRTRFVDSPISLDAHEIVPVIEIGLDARDNFSTPVLLPESTFSRLDEITKALEDRANGGKG